MTQGLAFCDLGFCGLVWGPPHTSFSSLVQQASRNEDYSNSVRPPMEIIKKIYIYNVLIHENWGEKISIYQECFRLSFCFMFFIFCYPSVLISNSTILLKIYPNQFLWHLQNQVWAISNFHNFFPEESTPLFHI